MKSIQRQIRAARALSAHEIRLAAAMGLISVDARAQTRLGFNDGIIYPPQEAAELAPGRAAAPSQRLSLSAARPRTLHALALLVDFSDNKGTRPASDFQNLLFNDANKGSMTAYYQKLSGGRLKVTGEAIGYIRAPQKYSYYTDRESGTGDSFPRNTPGLLIDALTSFCKNDNLKRFDTDGDGYVDGIFLIHAGKGAEAEADPARRKDMIWSHKWVLPSPFKHKGVSVYAYSTEPEDGRVGVFCHEFGHSLGLPDLYDTSYLSEGVGSWCLMGGGSWGNGGNSPTRMSCWCLARMGWIKPLVVRSARTLTIPTLEQNEKACYRVWTKGRSGPEYLLLENRQKTGQDSALPGSGLAVWHIDETQSDNTNSNSYMVGLVQADGKRDLERAANRGDAGDLFPGSANVTSASDSTSPSLRANDGSPTGLKLSSIKQTEGEISLRVTV
jgi:immune inhibitor A